MMVSSVVYVLAVACLACVGTVTAVRNGAQMILMVTKGCNNLYRKPV